jgi:hypothetical protein
VYAGDSISITASGSVVYWKSRDGHESLSCGPSGVGGSTQESTYLVPGLRRMSLVGKIGSSTFHIGSGLSFRAPATGPLYLGINDTVHAGGCADNDGYWLVEIRHY